MPTHHRGSESERRALNAHIKLMRATDSVVRRLLPLLSQRGLTLSQLGALEALFHLGPMCQKDLAEKLLQSGGNITMVINNLEKRNLVTRVREPSDRRFVTLHLTPEGRELIESVFPQHLAGIVEAFSVLSQEEQDLLGSLCRRLGKGSRPGGGENAVVP